MVDILGGLYRIYVVGMVIALLCVFIYMDRSSRKKNVAITETPPVAAALRSSKTDGATLDALTTVSPSELNGFQVDYPELSIDLPDYSGSYGKWELEASDDMRGFPGSDLFRTNGWSVFPERNAPLLALSNVETNDNPSDLTDSDYP